MDVLRWLSEFRTPFMDSLFLLVSDLASEILAILAICVLYWCIHKKQGLSVAFVWFVSAILVQGMKICFRIDRPWILDHAFLPVEGALANATGYSFPSGHTQSAFALYGTFGLMQKKKVLRIVPFVIAVLIGFSRMYLGVHTMADVVTSAAITVVLMFFVKWYWVDSPRQAKQLPVLIGIVFLLAAVLMVLSITLSSSGLIDTGYIRDAAKVAGSGLGFAAGMLLEKKRIDEPIAKRKILGHILRVAIGLAGVLAIQEITHLFPREMVVPTLCGYFLLTFWAVGIYPILLGRMDRAKEPVV